MTSICSIIFPIYNETNNLSHLLDQVKHVFETIHHWEYNIIIVDDGSTDNIIETIEALQKVHKTMVCIKLAKNFGHQTAIEAGLDYATGDVVIMMDGDLQHPPQYIQEMIRAYEKGYNVVQMVRSKPKKTLKGLLSQSFYYVCEKFTKQSIIKNSADFRLMSRVVVDSILAVPDKRKILRVVVPKFGFKTKILLYKEDDRYAGKPSYSFLKSFVFSIRILLNYTTIPLKFLFGSGCLLAGGSFIVGLVYTVLKLMYKDAFVPGFTGIIVSVYFLSGCILGAIGIIGHYLKAILNQIQGYPNYQIEKIMVASEVLNQDKRLH